MPSFSRRRAIDWWKGGLCMVGYVRWEEKRKRLTLRRCPLGDGEVCLLEGGGRLDRRQAVRQSLRQVAQMAVRRFSVLRGGEVSAVTDWIIPFLCGLGASILSAWGVGGGTLLLLVMTLFLDVDQRTAQGINLLFFLPTAASALVCHARGGYLDKPTLKSAVPLAVAAALAGAWIATNLDVAVLRKPFGVYLLLSGVSLLWPQRRKKQA